MAEYNRDERLDRISFGVDMGSTELKGEATILHRLDHQGMLLSDLDGLLMKLSEKLSPVTTLQETQESDEKSEKYSPEPMGSSVAITLHHHNNHLCKLMSQLHSLMNSVDL